jgi:hypothetical protein
VSFEFLYWVVTEDLGIPNYGTGDARTDPAGYLYDHRHTLGGSNYDGNGADTANPGTVTSVGIKHWIIAANNACGIAAQGVGWQGFYSGDTDPMNLDGMYLRWYSRYPAEEELDVFEWMYDELHLVWQDIASDPNHPRHNEVRQQTQTFTGQKRRKTIAACTTILTAMEFLTKN